MWQINYGYVEAEKQADILEFLIISIRSALLHLTSKLSFTIIIVNDSLLFERKREKIMATTKENILTTALQLFAKDGYEAVSVSMIAGALGMTKGALYKHYVNKRDIFDRIVTRMEERDAQRAAEFELPEGTLTEMTEKYCSTPINQLIQYSKAQFLYWTQEKFSSDFRKMLTIEQYRSEEMNQLYQQHSPLVRWDMLPICSAAWISEIRSRKRLPFMQSMFLLYSVYDGSADKAAVIAQMEEHLKAAGQRLKGEKG